MHMTILNPINTYWKQLAWMVRPLALALVTVTGCTPSTMSTTSFSGAGPRQGAYSLEVTPPSPDPRVGLRAGLFDAEEAAWNM